MNPIGRGEAGFAIHENLSLLHEGIAGPPGTNTGRCQVFVESDSLGEIGIVARHDERQAKRSGARKGSAGEDSKKEPDEAALALGLGFRESDGALAVFPLPTLFHHFDTLEALHDRALTGCATFTFERVVLGHRIRTMG